MTKVQIDTCYNEIIKNISEIKYGVAPINAELRKETLTTIKFEIDDAIEFINYQINEDDEDC